MGGFKSEIIDSEGYFGAYGGRYVPEVIRQNLLEVEEAFESARTDENFLKELQKSYLELSGRPTAFTPLNNLSEQLGGATIAIKNEGLNHTGAHKINHCLGQVLLAKRMGKKRIIAETGAGQHGYATATVCAKYGLECVVYMGAKDYQRQRPNVYWMELLGATVVPVHEGDQTLNDAVIAAFKDLIANPNDSFYLLGSAVGPHPYPKMNTYFQKIVSEETKSQCLATYGRLPDYVLACVGGGSNAMGAFFEFLDDSSVQLIGVEAGGHGDSQGEHAAKADLGKPGIFEGYKSYFLQEKMGDISGTSSISAGLDYCGLSPILAHLKDAGRVKFTRASNADTLQALQLCAQKEGIILALESAHAMAEAIQLAKAKSKNELIVVNASGRGEKDLFITMNEFQPEALQTFIKQLQND